MRTITLALTLTATLALGCGDKDETGTDSATDDSASDDTATDDSATDDSATDDSAADEAWQDMDRAARQAHMTAEVLPALQGLLDGVDGANTNPSCITCHGADMADVDFAMPNNPVALDPSAMPPTDASPLVSLMYQQFVPTFSALLDQEPFDPNTGEGFGCFSCHPMAQ